MRQVNNIILDIREEILILIIKELRETLNSNLHLLSHPLFLKKHMKKLRFRDLSIVLEFVAVPGIDPRSSECFRVTSSRPSVE